MSAVVEKKQVVQGGAFMIEDRTTQEIFTPEDFTEEHRMIAETTRQFIDNEVVPHIDELEKHDWKLARELVGKAADLGLIGANIPEEYGGLGLIKRVARWWVKTSGVVLPSLPRSVRRAALACCQSFILARKRRRLSTCRRSRPAK